MLIWRAVASMQFGRCVQYAKAASRLQAQNVNYCCEFSWIEEGLLAETHADGRFPLSVQWDNRNVAAPFHGGRVRRADNECVGFGQDFLHG